MGILDYFEAEKTTLTYQIRKKQNVAGGKVNIVIEDGNTLTGIFYEGKYAEDLVSERFRAKVDVVFLADPSDLNGNNPKDFDRLEFSNGRKFSLVHPDNILLSDEVFYFMLKELK